MAIVSSYPNAENISVNDSLLGTHFKESGTQTRSFPISDILALAPPIPPTPTLQEVTTVGATSTVPITITTTDNDSIVGISIGGVGVTGSSGYQGVSGYSSGGYGVYGATINGFGVYGSATNGYGVRGLSTNNTGVYGSSTEGKGIEGVSINDAGVYGTSTELYGVQGYSLEIVAVYGSSLDGIGVQGVSTTSNGVLGQSTDGVGVSGISTNSWGVYANTAAKPSGGVWATFSDSRIKENVLPYSKGLAEIMLINPVTYDYNGLAGMPKITDCIGVIAQEIKEVLPETVRIVPTKLNETDTEKTDLFVFDGNALTYALINAVKELKAEIELLKAR